MKLAFRDYSVCFLPFWEPYLSYASSRLRAVFPARALAAAGVKAHVGWEAGANIYIVTQLCSDRILSLLTDEKARGARIIYCVCDRHYANGGISTAGIQTKWRFEDLATIADAFVVPTTAMREELERQGVEKRIFVISDWRDYIDYLCAEPVNISDDAVWFGNPGTSNFRAAQPYIEKMMECGIDVKIVSNPLLFKGYSSEIQSILVQWRYETFVSTIRRASFSLIAFDNAERQKSINRFVTSISNGVPAILCGESTSADCATLYGFDEIVVRDPRDLARAVERVRNPTYRNRYITEMQRYFENELGDEAMVTRYVDMFDITMESAH